MLAAIGARRRVVLTVNQFYTAGRVVAESDLLTVLPRHFLESTGLPADLVVTALPFAVPPVHVDMVWHRRTLNAAAQQWLRAEVTDGARQVLAAHGWSERVDGAG